MDLKAPILSQLNRVSVTFSDKEGTFSMSMTVTEDVPQEVDVFEYQHTLADACYSKFKEQFDKFKKVNKPQSAIPQMSQQAPQQAPQQAQGTCRFCGAAMVLSQRTGKTYCSQKCWLNNQPPA